LIPGEDVVVELRLCISDLVALEVKLVDDVVLTKLGRDGITNGLLTDSETDMKTNGAVELLGKVVVELRLGLAPGNIFEDDGTPLELVGVTVGFDEVLCKPVENVTRIPDDGVDRLPLALAELTVDTTRDVVSLEDTVGRVDARLEFDVEKVGKDDAGAGLGTEELPELLEETSTVEVAGGLGKDWVEREDSSDDPGAKLETPRGPDTVEDILKELTEDTGKVVEVAVDRTFVELLGVSVNNEVCVFLDGTGRKIDNETETIIGALGCTLGRVDPDGTMTGLFVEPGPEPCGLLMLVLVGAVPDGRSGLCVFCGAPLDVDDLPNV
jgi:hypothetical protein